VISKSHVRKFLRINVLQDTIFGRLSRRRYSAPEVARGFEPHLAKPDTKAQCGSRLTFTNKLLAPDMRKIAQWNACNPFRRPRLRGIEFQRPAALQHPTRPRNERARREDSSAIPRKVVATRIQRGASAFAGQSRNGFKWSLTGMASLAAISTFCATNAATKNRFVVRC